MLTFLKRDQLAAGLVALGVKRGDRVGMWGPNSLEWVQTMNAVGRIGAILVNLNPAYQKDEIEYSLKKVQWGNAYMQNDTIVCIQPIACAVVGHTPVVNIAL